MNIPGSDLTLFATVPDSLAPGAEKLGAAITVDALAILRVQAREVVRSAVSLRLGGKRWPSGNRGCASCSVCCYMMLHERRITPSVRGSIHSVDFVSPGRVHVWRGLQEIHTRLAWLLVGHESRALLGSSAGNNHLRRDLHGDHLPCFKRLFGNSKAELSGLVLSSIRVGWHALARVWHQHHSVSWHHLSRQRLP